MRARRSSIGRLAARALTIGAAGLLAGSGTAQAASLACLTPREFTAIATYGLPDVISGAVGRCAAALPADAFLRSDGMALAQRYAASRATAWPAARAAFVRVTNGNGQISQMIGALPDPTLQQMFDGLITGRVVALLTPDRCFAVDRLVSLLSPLAPEAIAEVVGIAVGLAARGGPARLGQLTICGA